VTAPGALAKDAPPYSYILSYPVYILLEWLTLRQGQLLEETRQLAPHFPGGHPGWELAPELPSSEEILASACEVGELPHNPVDETWPSKEAYLKTQYTLLRREGTEGLRHAVNSVRSKPDIRDNEAICVYKKVCAILNQGSKVHAFTIPSSRCESSDI
jgi:hypothetical protein